MRPRRGWGTQTHGDSNNIGKRGQRIGRINDDGCNSIYGYRDEKSLLMVKLDTINVYLVDV